MHKDKVKLEEGDYNERFYEEKFLAIIESMDAVSN